MIRPFFNVTSVTLCLQPIILQSLSTFIPSKIGVFGLINQTPINKGQTDSTAVTAASQSPHSNRQMAAVQPHQPKHQQAHAAYPSPLPEPTWDSYYFSPESDRDVSAASSGCSDHAAPDSLRPRSPPPSPTPAAAPDCQRLGLWSIGSLLGKGSFSTVRRAVHTITGVHAVCKTTHLPRAAGAAREKQKLYVLRELAALAAADHPNVVRLYDAVFEDQDVHLFLEHVEGFELFDYLSQEGRPGRMDENEAKVIAVQCLLALDHLHARGLVHRDYKLDNVMVIPPHTSTNPNPFPLVKLIDFNLAGMFDGASEMRETVGCIHYSSPWICNAAILAERYANQRYPPREGGATTLHLPGMDGETAQANDVWAMCVGLFGMLQGYFPFRGTTIQALESEIRAICRPARSLGTRLSYPIPISTQAKHFIETGMDPAHPVSARDLLRHPWLASLDDVAFEYPLLRRAPSVKFMDAPIKMTRETADDSWYTIGILAQAQPRSARRTAETLETMQLEALHNVAEALAAIATMAMARRGGELQQQEEQQYSPAGPAFECKDEAGAPVFRAASCDSGYGSAEFDANGIVVRA